MKEAPPRHSYAQLKPSHCTIFTVLAILKRQTMSHVALLPRAPPCLQTYVTPANARISPTLQFIYPFVANLLDPIQGFAMREEQSD